MWARSAPRKNKKGWGVEGGGTGDGSRQNIYTTKLDTHLSCTLVEMDEPRELLVTWGKLRTHRLCTLAEMTEESGLLVVREKLDTHPSCALSEMTGQGTACSAREVKNSFFMRSGWNGQTKRDASGARRAARKTSFHWFFSSLPSVVINSLTT